MPGVTASACSMVDDLAARARRDGFTRLCAFAHDPTFFVRRGFSIVPHTWVPEKIAHDCNSCPLFRNCGQYAVVLAISNVERSSDAPSERSANGRRPMSDLRPIDGGVTAPAGFRASGLHCGIKASGKPDLSLIVSDTPATAAGVFTMNLAKAAPVLVCQDHLASSGGRATRDRHQQRLRQRLHRPAGRGRRAGDGAAHRGRASAAATTRCWSRRPA